jgi:hypothetical protein
VERGGGGGLSSSRLHQLDNWPRRFSADTGRSASTLDLTRSPRLGSEAGGGGGGGYAAEDLRRRLALGPSGSTTSLSSVAAGPPAVPTPPVAGGERRPSAQRAHDSDDAASIDSGVPSTSATTTLRPDSEGGGRAAKQPRSRIHQNGVDVGRVSPAVAQDMTNANGLINVEALAPYRADEGARTPSEQGTPLLGGLIGHHHGHGHGHGRRESRQFFPSAPRFSSTYGSFRVFLLFFARISLGILTRVCCSGRRQRS